MTKDEMKDRISIALKDPILQQGFEIICKNLAELEEENEKLRGCEHIVQKMKDYGFDTFMSVKEFLQKHTELEKENAELKKELEEKGQHLDLTEREWAKDTNKMIYYKTQLTKAKEIIKEFADRVYYEGLSERAEDFIKELDK